MNASPSRPRFIAAASTSLWPLILGSLLSFAELSSAQSSAPPTLTLARDKNFLIVRGAFPGQEIRINYLEAFCRAGSTNADWVKHTVVPHRTELVSASPDGKEIKLRSTVDDGLIVDHDIRAEDDAVIFDVVVHNPTNHINEAQWAQPCIRLGNFAGGETDAPKCPDIKLERAFIFLEGKLTRLPTQPWATTGLYTPGQTYCPKNVPRTDVNPRPLSTLVPSNGLIGCFSKDGLWLFATAFEPYQELFQGVAQCLHSDFRIGVVQPGETKKIRGKIYLLPNDVPALLKRYAADFPEQQ